MAKATDDRRTTFPQMKAGMKFGRLVAVEFLFIDKHRNRQWRFHCDCGNKAFKAAAYFVQRGDTTSCGCYRLENLAVAHRTHGGWRTPEFKAWGAIIERCTNPNNKNYSSYGGRGITICDRWRNSFENFLADMGPRPSPGHSIDRIDNNSGYEPTNCRWATIQQQNSNRRSNRIITFQGKQMIFTDALKIFGLSYSTVTNRLQRGWPLERALTEPPKRLYGVKKGMPIVYRLRV